MGEEALVRTPPTSPTTFTTCPRPPPPVEGISAHNPPQTCIPPTLPHPAPHLRTIDGPPGGLLASPRCGRGVVLGVQDLPHPMHRGRAARRLRMLLQTRCTPPAQTPSAREGRAQGRCQVSFLCEALGRTRHGGGIQTSCLHGRGGVWRGIRRPWRLLRDARRAVACLWMGCLLEADVWPWDGFGETGYHLDGFSTSHSMRESVGVRHETISWVSMPPGGMTISSRHRTTPYDMMRPPGCVYSWDGG